MGYIVSFQDKPELSEEYIKDLSWIPRTFLEAGAFSSVREKNHAVKYERAAMHTGQSQGRNYGILTPNPMLAAWCMAIPMKTVAKTVKQLGYEYGLRGRLGGEGKPICFIHIFSTALYIPMNHQEKSFQENVKLKGLFHSKLRWPPSSGTDTLFPLLFLWHHPGVCKGWQVAGEFSGYIHTPCE